MSAALWSDSRVSFNSFFVGMHCTNERYRLSYIRQYQSRLIATIYTSLREYSDDTVMEIDKGEEYWQDIFGFRGSICKRG